MQRQNREQRDGREITTRQARWDYFLTLIFNGSKVFLNYWIQTVVHKEHFLIEMEYKRQIYQIMNKK
jgi:hypothetical protein